MQQLPFLDINDPAFSIRSDAVRDARASGPYARTPYGLAVLRYAEVNALVNDKRLIQGSAAWSRHNNITGPWAHWWSNIVLNREGQDHVRLRKLVNPAFASKHVANLVPEFQGHGTGGAVLVRLLAETDAAGLPVRLNVLKESPAARFYERHGFVRTHEEEWDVFYERPLPL